MFYRISSTLCRTIVTASAMFVLLTPTWGDDPVPQQNGATQATPKPNQATEQPQLLPPDATPQPRSIDPTEQQQILQQLQKQSKHLLADPTTRSDWQQAPRSGWPQAPLAELQKMQQQLIKAKQQLFLAHQELVEQGLSNRPQLENGKLHAYRLKHISPALLSETLETFLGNKQLRLVSDQENKVLIAFSNADLEDQISKLVHTLDAKAESTTTEPTNTPPTQSLMLRIFWLAEGDPSDRSTDPEEFLPKAVLKAVERLGLQTQKLIAQSTTSLAVGQGPDTSEGFQFQFPALSDEEIFTLEGRGEMVLEEQPLLHLQIMMNTPTSPIELSGIITAPLDHFMVLGTAHYATEPDLTTRFAFVVQVVEAHSFAPEE